MTISHPVTRSIDPAEVAAAAVFLGDDELARDGATVRNLDDGSQTEVSLADLKDHLAEYR